jgi:TM2 domain-containing membrane protein YozV
VSLGLGLNDNLPVGALVPEPRHRSAGLAFGLSLLVPGLGQFYCGKTGRGGMTLGFWLLALVLCFVPGLRALVAYFLFVMMVLWIFSFLDAYFTAIEINKGQDDVVDVQNPRVAVTLNLLTAGFGYFYLGERTKGITIFIAMQVARWMLPATGFFGVSIALALFVVQLLVAEDAYRIARRQLKEALGPEAAQPAANAAPASRLPVQVPVVLACLLPLGFVALVVLGLVLRTSSGKRPAVASSSNRSSSGRAQSGSDRRQVRNDAPVPVVDFATAVQDVQRVQRKSERRKDEVANLKQDVRMLSLTLGGKKIDAADAMVAHYYRALALSMINTVHEHEGESMDLAGARTARADLDKIINAGTVLTYVPEVSQSNAEYLAGSITRNQLHDEPAAYSYWEKCASNSHAGCLHALAGARITGDGGQKVDVNEALALHTSVYDTGVKFKCAGAQSAMSIAEINYFLGVRRSGDDELEWSKKADGLLDQVEANGSSRNACQRAGIEVREFLFQLSRGHRDDNILQDALSRLDDESVNTKAVIQFIAGAIDENGFNAVVSSSKYEGSRCSAYFDAMWYAELRGEGEMARRFDQRLVDIGRFHCGQSLVFAKKFKF